MHEFQTQLQKLKTHITTHAHNLPHAPAESQADNSLPITEPQTHPSLHPKRHPLSRPVNPPETQLANHHNPCDPSTQIVQKLLISHSTDSSHQKTTKTESSNVPCRQL
ncbi:hypothetical protein M758_8G113200, partial [Ceratodon purpureus]